jgi:hypothetical protein
MARAREIDDGDDDLPPPAGHIAPPHQRETDELSVASWSRSAHPPSTLG